MAVSVNCVNQSQCVGTVSKLAILCAWEAPSIYVFWKAAQCQKKNERYDMKYMNYLINPGIYIDLRFMNAKEPERSDGCRTFTTYFGYT